GPGVFTKLKSRSEGTKVSSEARSAGDISAHSGYLAVSIQPVLGFGCRGRYNHDRIPRVFRNKVPGYTWFWSIAAWGGWEDSDPDRSHNRDSHGLRACRRRLC